MHLKLKQLAITHSISKFEFGVLFLAIFSGLLNAIFYFNRRTSFWQDEIIAITHTLQPLPSFFIEVVRNDIHPFFYFLLLKAWSIPNIASDLWILSSSLVGSIFSITVLGIVCHRVFGLRTALWAIGIYCVLPNFAWAAGNLRMYALLPGIAILNWYFNRAYLIQGLPRYIVGILLLQFILAYMHAIQFFFLGIVVLAVLLEQYHLVSRRRLSVWLLVQFISMLLMLPLIGSALIRGTEPLSLPNLTSLYYYPARLISGWGVGPLPEYLLFGGAFIFFFLLTIGIFYRPTRMMTLLIPVGGLLAAMCISLVLKKPIFKPPIFTANLIPFLIISAAASIANQKKLLLASYIFIVLMGCLTWPWAKYLNSDGNANYKNIAFFINEHTTPGDVVVIPNRSTYWGVMRYAVGPNWGYPLNIMPLQHNSSWKSLISKLDSVWVEKLGLVPKADAIQHQGILYIIGANAMHHTTSNQITWVVNYVNSNDEITLGQLMQPENIHWINQHFSITRLIKNSSGNKFYQTPKFKNISSHLE